MYVGVMGNVPLIPTTIQSFAIQKRFFFLREKPSPRGHAVSGHIDSNKGLFFGENRPCEAMRCPDSKLVCPKGGFLVDS